MKTFTKIVTYLVVSICIVSSCFIFSGCNTKEQYTAEKYTNISYGEYERQTLDLYLPKEKTGTVGLVLFLHGGGWTGGDKSMFKNDLNKWCAVYGYASASINYHYISNQFHLQDIVEDISASLQKIKEVAKSNNVNIEKVILSGGSAGGHLALYYAYRYAKTATITPVAVVTYSGPADLTDPSYYSTEEDKLDYLGLFSLLCGETFTPENYLEEEMQSKLLDSSPIYYVNENTIPTLICHAVEDDIVPYSNATNLANRLKSYGVRCDLVTYENSDHGLGNDKKHSRQAKKLFSEYAKTYLD